MSEFENDGLTITQRAEKKGEQKGYDKAKLEDTMTLAEYMGKPFEEALWILRGSGDRNPDNEDEYPVAAADE